MNQSNIHSQYKLTVELIPSTSWFKNLRSQLTKSEWDRIRKNIYRRANYKCEICGGIGHKHPVECHEIWEYTEDGIQRLTGLIALCPSCHQVKHLGFAQMQGNLDKALNHLAMVNDITYQEAYNYAAQVFKEYRTRSKQTWDLDLTYLEEL